METERQPPNGVGWVGVGAPEELVWRGTHNWQRVRKACFSPSHAIIKADNKKTISADRNLSRALARGAARVLNFKHPPPRLRSAAPAPAPAGRPASELESILVEFPGAYVLPG